jgi:pilus assembly protein CpaB
MRRRTLLLIVSILVAAVGTALIGLYVRGADNRAANDNFPVRVLTAQTNVLAGTQANQINSRSENRPRIYVPTGAVRDAAQLAGKVAVTKIYSGQVLELRMFGTASAGDVGIAPTEVGITVYIPIQQEAGGLLRVGSKVDIYALPAKGDTAKLAERIAPNIEVIQIGNNHRESDATGDTTGNAADDAPAGQNATADDIPSTMVGLTLSSILASKVKTAEASGRLFFAVLPAEK